MGNILDNVENCVDRAIAAVGNHLIIGAPLGLGKPVQLLNAFYHRVEADPSLSLHIYTALCLERPSPGTDIEASLAEPIIERLFGDYEELAFMKPLREGRLPPNITISEVYFKAGSMKNVPVAQQNYISSNYTHIARDMLAADINILAQMVAARDTPEGLAISLSCNTDISLEIFDLLEQEQRPLLVLAQIHDDLPFMQNDAEVPSERFDWIVRAPECNKTLFAVPNAPVPARDYAAALHASSLIEDGGTLQIGIGALGDAVAHMCIVRQQHNSQYRTLLEQLSAPGTVGADSYGLFNEGLYVSTEMFVNGMMHLIEHGIVKRHVYDNLPLQQGLNRGLITTQVNAATYNYGRQSGLIPRRLAPDVLTQLQYWGITGTDVEICGDTLLVDGQAVANDTDDPVTRAALLSSVHGGTLRHGRIMHGGFFLGPLDFYNKLRNLDAAMQDQLCMTGVRRTNQLLLDYPLYCAQRRKARFINTGMIVSLSGAVTSDALEDGTVISGVGGQYNFVAMAHDLPGARSILCIRSTRGEGKHLQSNVVPFYGHTTIPRHLRDIVVTEYGIADLRGQCDAEVIKRLINVADSRFQSQLLSYAKNHGKLPADYRIPFEARNNTPQRLQQVLAPLQHSGLLPDYPFGTELSEQEIALTASLRNIKALSEEPGQFIARALRAVLHRADEEAAQPFLARIELEHPDTTREFLLQQLLMLELEDRGLLKAS